MYIYQGYDNLLKMIGKHKYTIFLFILIIFHIINNYFWIKSDQVSFGCDTIFHNDIMILLHQDLKTIFSLPFSLIFKCESTFSAIFKDPLCWPRLVHFIAALTAFISRDILFWFRFSGIIYFIVMIISIYLIGSEIHSRAAGLIAASLVSFYPAIFGSSRNCGLDLPLTSVVCLIFYFLLRSDEFRQIRYSLFFGLSLGIGMLVKGQLIFFIVFPLLYVIFNGLRDKAQRKRIILNICGAFCLAFLIALIWWHRIFLVGSNFIGDIFLIKYNTIRNNLIFYLFAVYLNISPIFSGVFLFSLLFYLRKLNKVKLILIFWFATPFLIYSVILFLHDRYIFPIFGAVALISAIGLLEAPFKKAIFILFYLAIILGVYQFFAMSYYEKPNHVNLPNEWAHPPRYNNHQQVINRFNEEIVGYNLSVNNIAIVEESYFHGDYCIRLKCFIEVLNNKNIVFLSADGVESFFARPTDKFLSNMNNYEFIIAFSIKDNHPDFTALLTSLRDMPKRNIGVITDSLEKIEILQKDILIPEEIGIFLLKKKSIYQLR